MRVLLAVGLALVVTAAPGLAQPPEGAADGPPTLEELYEALAERRLVAAESGSAERLRALVVRGEDLYLDGRWDEAQRVLHEAVESPRFRDFADLEGYRSAELMLAGALRELGALRSAWRYLLRLLERGPDDPQFGPAYRRAVDVALDSADVAARVAELEQAVPQADLPPDAANELRYARGRARYDAEDWAGAADHFEQVGRRSRFYANARYLQGAIAVRGGRFDEAEAHFCAIATTPDTDAFTFFVDDRFFAIRDLTWLALGRVAHERFRGDDAFYYYFQVPQDSVRVTEALFEAAWSMYEASDFDTAVDLLDQLETRFAASPFVHEATLLRGYIHLGRCEFEEADRLFTAFQARFGPVVTTIDRILANPARRERLVEELLATEAQAARDAEQAGDGREADPPEPAPTDPRALLLSLLQVDPSFYRLYRELRTLDAETARAGRVAAELGAIRARLGGTDAPAPSVALPDEPDEGAALAGELDGARATLRALTEQLDAMRAAGAAAERLAPIEARLAELGMRVDRLEARVREARAYSAAPPPAANDERLEALLARAEARASAYPTRVAAVRGRLVGAANAAALTSLRDLRRRLGGYLRRSRIGRIDAVMGSKRRIEIQIQSLAAGRFPPELQDPLAIQGLLRDDEEYWPFEGEYWADEFQEDADLEGADLDEELLEEDLDDGTAPPDGAPGEELR